VSGEGAKDDIPEIGRRILLHQKTGCSISRGLYTAQSEVISVKVTSKTYRLGIVEALNPRAPFVRA
jgi:hypothetical protein